MHTPLVSIVVATYKSRRDYLSEAITSALAQTWRDIEVIVSDDSPDDGLRRLVESFDDVRVRYRRNAPALGVARNHWACFRAARGEYIAILNHDDWLTPTFVEQLAGALLANPQAVLAFCDHWIIDADGRRSIEATEQASVSWGRARLAEGMHRPFFDLVQAQTIPMAMGTVFRRSSLPEVLPDDAGPAYDLWLSYLLSRGGGGAWFVPQRLSAWRTHAANLTSQAGADWLLGTARCWQAMAHDPCFHGLRQSARRGAARAYRSCAVHSWSQGRSSECLRYALRSLRCLPTLKSLVACALPLVPRSLASGPTA